MTVPNNLFSLSQDALVELYQLDTSNCHYLNGQKIAQGAQFYWTPGTVNEGPVSFAGQQYISAPISSADWQWNGQGTVPQPKLTVENISGLITGLTISLDDLIGAKVTRIRTFLRHLDGQSQADGTIMFEPDVFYINRKSRHDYESIEFELATSFDQVGKQIPGRVILANMCLYSYRQYVNGGFIMGECPYAGSNYFAEDDTPTSDPSLDVCSHHLNGCLVRFGSTAPLPFNGFPGAGQTQSMS